SPVAAASAAPRSPQSGGTLKLGVVGTSAPQTPFYVADHIKAFDKYGTTVSWQLIDGNVATVALAGGDVDAVLESPSPLLTFDVNGGGDQVLVGSTLNHSQYALCVDPSINSANDLKGMVIGN